MPPPVRADLWAARGLTCIRFFTLSNEPNLTFGAQDGTFEDYEANRNDAGVPSATGTARNAHFDNIIARVAYRDSDNDQMADDWEIANGLNPDEISDAANQDDGDTLTNLQEFQAGTNPFLADTDADGYNDEVEVTAGSDPLDATSFSVVTPLEPLVVESSGFNVGGDFEVPVSGLSTSHSYRLVRGTDLTSFPDVVEEKVAYTVWYSLDLEHWFEDTGATQDPGLPDENGVETVAVTLTPALLAEPKWFVRVQAAGN